MGPQGPTGPVQPVTLVVGPVTTPLVGAGTFAGNFTVTSVATCPAGTTILGGGAKVGLGGGTGGALYADYPNANSWVAGAVSDARPRRWHDHLAGVRVLPVSTSLSVRLSGRKMWRGQRHSRCPLSFSGRAGAVSRRPRVVSGSRSSGSLPGTVVGVVALAAGGSALVRVAVSAVRRLLVGPVGGVGSSLRSGGLGVGGRGVWVRVGWFVVGIVCVGWGV